MTTIRPVAIVHFGDLTVILETEKGLLKIPASRANYDYFGDIRVSGVFDIPYEEIPDEVTAVSGWHQRNVCKNCGESMPGFPVKLCPHCGKMHYDGLGSVVYRTVKKYRRVVTKGWFRTAVEWKLVGCSEERLNRPLTKRRETHAWLLQVGNKQPMIVFGDSCPKASEPYGELLRCGQHEISVLMEFEDVERNPIDISVLWPMFGCLKPCWDE